MQLEPFGRQPVAEVELLKVGHLVALLDDEVFEKRANLQQKMLYCESRKILLFYHQK